MERALAGASGSAARYGRLPAAHLISIVIAVPFAAALTSLLLARTRLRGIAARLFAVVGVLSALPLWSRYDPAGSTWQLAERVPLAAGISYAVAVDGFAIAMI